MNKILTYIILVCCAFLSATPLSAQMFTRETSNNQVEKATTAKSSSEVKQKETSAEDFDNDLNMTEEEKAEVLKRLQKELNPRIKDGNLVVNPVDLGATEDGSKRGSVAFISTDMNSEDEGNIFLFYSDFRISRTTATGLGCRVRFHIMNGLNSKLSNLSVKLVWPGLNTPLSFNNVNPNTENYFDYALFGEGCYQMDKIPNIVVNRCRVKGMSQEACANRIRWLAKR